MNDKKRRRVRKSDDKRRQESSGRRQIQTKKDIIATLKENFGNVSATCEKVGISRFTFYRWRDEDPDFNRDVEEINERTLDFVESKLIQGIQEGNARLIIFYLSVKGRGRGYGQQKDATGEKSSGIALNITPEEAEY